jgi:hypothetical protein
MVFSQFSLIIFRLILFFIFFRESLLNDDYFVVMYLNFEDFSNSFIIFFYLLYGRILFLKIKKNISNTCKIYMSTDAPKLIARYGDCDYTKHVNM